MFDTTYDDLVSSIYRASHDPLHFKAALTATVEAVDATAGSLTVIDRKAGQVTMTVTSGTTPLADLEYAERYGRLDPRAPVSMAAPLAEWRQCHHYFSAEFVETNPFYQEFLIPHGLRWIAGTRLFDTETHSGIIGVHSGVDRSPLQEPELALLRRITPHWQGALALQHRVMAAQDQWSMMRGLLDALDCATLVCDSAAQVLIGNDTALELISESDGLAFHGDRLVATRSDAQRSLSAMFSTASNGSALRIQRPSGRADYQLIVRQLQEHQTLLSLSGSQRFVVTISDPFRVSVTHGRALAQLYDFTPAESRVATQLMAGKDAQSVADALGSKLPTIRTQIASMMGKTGTTRQSELMLLLRSALALR